MNNTDQNYTDFLFTTPSYLTGAATVFNLGGSFYDYNRCESGEEADCIAIANDFIIIGDDLRTAIKEVTKIIEISVLMANDPTQREVSLTQVEQELKKINPQIFNGVKPDKKEELIRTFLSVTKIHSGPLPSPETLQAYNDAVPNGAKMIIDAFLSQTNHRMEMEKTVITSQQKQSAWGQIYAFIIAMFVLAGSMWLILKGHDVSGSILGSVDLVSLVTVFIMGRFYQANNLQSKNPKKTPAKKAD